MSKVSKEFYVDKYDLENMSSFTVSVHPVPMRDRTLKITISYEIDREVAIKESDFEKYLQEWDLNTPSIRVTDYLKNRIFGGGENE